MNQERKALRMGVVVILLAAVWRFAAGERWAPVAEFFADPAKAAFLVYLGTGRVVHPRANAQADAQTDPPPTETHQPEMPKLQFTKEDAALFSMYDYAGKAVDTEAMLLQSLQWELTGSQPTVLILHTHATESYTKTGQDYVESALYRTLDADYNMVAIGARLARQLEIQGISVLHDTTLHDETSYNGSYNSSRKAVQAYLEQYPSLELVLDLHRDAALDANGRQVAMTATVDGETVAQLMLVVGSDAAGLSHPNWQENMALAVKLQVTLQKRWEGIARPLCFRAQRFNQDLMPGYLLIEVGTAGNTQSQALAAADRLALAIAALAHGTE